jgi:hypothetical protein
VLDPSEGSSKLIPIHEESNHQIVHLFRLGKAQRATHEPLNPGLEIDVLALDFLCVLLAYVGYVRDTCNLSSQGVCPVE